MEKIIASGSSVETVNILGKQIQIFVPKTGEIDLTTVKKTDAEYIEFNYKDGTQGFAMTYPGRPQFFSDKVLEEQLFSRNVRSSP